MPRRRSPRHPSSSISPGSSSRPRRARVITTATLAVLGGLVVTAVLWKIAAPPVLLSLARSAISSAVPWQGAAVRIGGMEVEGLRRVLVSDLEIEVESPGNVLRADTVELSFSALSLLRGRRLSTLLVAGLHVDATRSDGTWTWLEVRGGNEATNGAGAMGREPADADWTVGRMSVRRASADVRGEDGATIVSVEGLVASADDLMLGRAGEVSVDGIAFRFQRP